MYAVTATAVKHGDNGETTTRQVPTFYLDPRTQGIVDDKHAASIALDVLSTFHDEKVTFNIWVEEV